MLRLFHLGIFQTLPKVWNDFGQKIGSYQYVIPNGELQTVTYVADEFGFRTEDFKLQVAPIHNTELPIAAIYEHELTIALVHKYILPVAPINDGVAHTASEKTPDIPIFHQNLLKSVLFDIYYF